MNIVDMISLRKVKELRYTIKGAPLAAHSGVITPRNRILFRVRYALLCATTDTPFTAFN